MEALYSKPLRVYLILGALALWGILSGLSLPISLFPVSSQPRITVEMGYGSYSPQQFNDSIGRFLEPRLQGLRVTGVAVRNLEATYGDKNVEYLLEFGWGADPDEARKTVQAETSAALAGREEAIVRSMQVYSNRSSRGFFAVSFYSPLKSLDELHDTLKPLITPIKSKVPDAEQVALYNPNSKEITVRISPELLAIHHLSTMQIEKSIREAITALNGGTIRIGEKDLQITLPKQAVSLETLETIRVSPLSQAPVLLKDVAKLSVVVSKDSLQRFRTSGIESLILWAPPKEGGNIKRMSDDIMRELTAAQKQWPEDVQFKILVNPSDFINASINGVFKEVGLAAFLAVFVLFMFIGSFRNVATAAIEIPLSLIMAFILMKLTGMNLNLISLGGLALSAGMNVDASVVVLENIMRHFDKKKGELSWEEKVQTLLAAVNEVKIPIIASTVASLVVFAPLVFTNGLTNALLGDLAKAVIFSHGLSAIVALVLVPTIRLQLMRGGKMEHGRSPIEGFLSKMENFYRTTLTGFLKSTRTQLWTVVAIMILLPTLTILVVPRLKKEVIGRPETDWLIVGISSPLFTNIRQMESEMTNLEADLAKNFGDKVRYTFTQIMGPTTGIVMMRLESRKMVDELSEKAESIYKNTPTLFYFVERWNPSELRIPDPADFEVELLGGTPERRQQVAEDIMARLSDRGIFDKYQQDPAISREKTVTVVPNKLYSSATEVLNRGEFSHFLRTALDGLYIDDLTSGVKVLPIYLRFPDSSLTKLEHLKGLPFGFEGKLVPLGALASFSIQPKPPQDFRVNQNSLIRISGRMNKANQSQKEEHIGRANVVIKEFRDKIATQKDVPLAEMPSLSRSVPDRELREALDQLKWAVLISTILIFLTMVLQLGDIVQAGLVMLAIPLGLIGVICSLFIFGSNLSLNSGLGTILLNGIAVANSIILVDFIQKLYQQGRPALHATVEASTARMRPILMTSLTTVLGMFPIALGMGEGGKILQPLGVAVCGGLWVSTLMTLYIVPALQYQWLASREKKTQRPVFKGNLSALTIDDKSKRPPEATP